MMEIFKQLVLPMAIAVGGAMQVAATESKMSLLSGDWKLTTFNGCTTNDVAIEQTERAWSLRLLTSPKPGGSQKRIWSMTHRLPPFGGSDIFKLEFDGRCRNPTGRQIHIFCATTGGPGMQRPAKRQMRKLSAKWERHEVIFSMTDVLPTCVLEILWEGAWMAGDAIELRDIRFVPIDRPLSLDVLQPRNMTLPPDVTNRTASGYALFPKRCFGGIWRIDLVPQSGGDVVRTVSGKISECRTEWRLETEGLAEGAYALRLVVAGEPERRRPLFIGPPAPGSFVVRNGRVERDGKPFFPICLDHCAQWNIALVNKIGKDIGSEHLTLESAYRDIAAHGINVIHGSLMDPVALAKAAKPFGLLALSPLRNQKPEIDNIAGWYGRDEPDSDVDRQKAREYYAFAKYGNRPDVVYSAMYHPEALEYNRTEGAYCDVLSYDEYVIRTARSDFRTLSARLAKAAEIARRNPDIVFGFAPQAFVHLGLEPTPAQLRAETYLSIAHGARALCYYAYVENWSVDFTTAKGEHGLPTATGQSRNPKRRNWWLKESDLWDEIKTMNGEFALLQDYIFSDSPDKTIRSLHADVVLSARQVGDRVRAVVVNLTPDPVEASVSSERARTFKASFADETLRLEAGATIVPFKPYEVKILDEVVATGEGR